jgi:2-C-methyl-D-erythritol 2,4-cyclodiphosphate synthase
MGYDLHRLESGGKLILGGVDLDSPMGAVAHSDGDALVHAIIDALVTPATGENIGSLFPDTDPAYKGISSLELLRRANESLGGIVIQNIDAVIVLDAPKLSGHIDAMRRNIAAVLGIEPSQVGIKAKTSENTRPGIVEAYAVLLFESK